MVKKDYSKQCKLCVKNVAAIAKAIFLSQELQVLRDYTTDTKPFWQST